MMTLFLNLVEINFEAVRADERFHFISSAWLHTQRLYLEILLITLVQKKLSSDWLDWSILCIYVYFLLSMAQYLVSEVSSTGDSFVQKAFHSLTQPLLRSGHLCLKPGNFHRKLN